MTEVWGVTDMLIYHIRFRISGGIALRGPSGSLQRAFVATKSEKVQINVIFTIEFAVRCAAATDLKNLYLDAYMYFDFFAVVPFWAEKIGAVLEFETEGAFFKILMALRMLRLLKISRQYDGSIVIVRALKVRRARRALASSPRSGLKAELSLSLSRCRSPRSACPSSSSWSP